jgi:parallel beta-helix repeat protein
MDLTFAPPFHIVVRGNIVHDNKIAPNNPVPCGSHTDGNGIILDTFLDQTTNTIPFPFRTLVTGNVTYANGGRGIHVFRTSNATVANNTAFGNGTDTCINAYYLGDLSQAGGSNNVWANNIAQAVLTARNTSCGKGSFCGARNAPIVGGSDGFTADKNNTYSNNVVFGAHGVQMFNNDQASFSCLQNKCMTNPRLADPLSHNFALLPASPAIDYALLKAIFHWGLADAGACLHTISVCPARGYLVR